MTAFWTSGRMRSCETVKSIVSNFLKMKVRIGRSETVGPGTSQRVRRNDFRDCVMMKAVWSSSWTANYLSILSIGNDLA